MLAALSHHGICPLGLSVGRGGFALGDLPAAAGSLAQREGSQGCSCPAVARGCEEQLHGVLGLEGDSSYGQMPASCTCSLSAT